MILSAISRSRIDVSHVKQWSENGLRRRNSEVTLDQKLCLECEIQNPLNESVICEDMIVMVKENSSFIEVEKTSVSLQALESRSTHSCSSENRASASHKYCLSHSCPKCLRTTVSYLTATPSTRCSIKPHIGTTTKLLVFGRSFSDPPSGTSNNCYFCDT